jgi:hypothetical protein
MDRTELPIPDYDHLPGGSLAHRIRSLPAPDLRRLLDHEQQHGNRLAIVQLLTRRLHDLESGALPSPGDPKAEQPEHAPPPAGGSAGNPAASPTNNQPLRHGVAEQTRNRDIRAR